MLFSDEDWSPGLPCLYIHGHSARRKCLLLQLHIHVDAEIRLRRSLAAMPIYLKKTLFLRMGRGRSLTSIYSCRTPSCMAPDTVGASCPRSRRPEAAANGP